jgi:hypothetical protein
VSSREMHQRQHRLFLRGRHSAGQGGFQVSKSTAADERDGRCSVACFEGIKGAREICDTVNILAITKFPYMLTHPGIVCPKQSKNLRNPSQHLTTQSMHRRKPAKQRVGKCFQPKRPPNSEPQSVKPKEARESQCQASPQPAKKVICLGHTHTLTTARRTSKTHGLLPPLGSMVPAWTPSDQSNNPTTDRRSRSLKGA